jgi:hypothetical protein
MDSQRPEKQMRSTCPILSADTNPAMIDRYMLTLRVSPLVTEDTNPRRHRRLPVLAFADMRLTLHSPGTASQTRDSDRYASAPAFAAARPIHPCTGVRSVRRDFVSRRKGIRSHPHGPSSVATAALRRDASPSVVRCGPAQTPVRALATVLLTPVANRSSHHNLP